MSHGLKNSDLRTRTNVVSKYASWWKERLRFGMLKLLHMKVLVVVGSVGWCVLRMLDEC